MGQAHSRSARRIPGHFPQRSFDPHLVVCADPVAERRRQAVEDFGFERAVEDWHEAVTAPDVDAVWVTAPNMLHLPMIEAATAAGKAVFSEKPIGGKPEHAVAALGHAQAAGVATGVGYCYLWSPLVLHARELIASGALGEITHYRGRFLSMYGSDPMGLLTWRFFLDQAGYGVTSDILSHSVAMAQFLARADHRGRRDGQHDDPAPPAPDRRRQPLRHRQPAGPDGGGRERGLRLDAVPLRGRGHRDLRGQPHRRRPREPERLRGLRDQGLAHLEPRADQRAAVLRRHRLAELRLHDDLRRRALPVPRSLRPGQANSIGFEDLITIQDFAFLEALATGETVQPGVRRGRRRRQRAAGPHRLVGVAGLAGRAGPEGATR